MLGMLQPSWGFVQHQEGGDPSREGGPGALAHKPVFQQRRNPILSMVGPQNTPAKVARAGGLLAGKVPGAATVPGLFGATLRVSGTQTRVPLHGHHGKLWATGSSQLPAQNRGVCWAGKTEKNTPALQRGTEEGPSLQEQRRDLPALTPALTPALNKLLVMDLLRAGGQRHREVSETRSPLPGSRTRGLRNAPGDAGKPLSARG